MQTARRISRTRHSSEWLSEKASGGSSQWTAAISWSIAFTDGSVLQSSHRRTREYGSPLTRSARPSRVAQPSLAGGRSIALTSSGGECGKKAEAYREEHDILGKLMPMWQRRRWLLDVSAISAFPRFSLA